MTGPIIRLELPQNATTPLLCTLERPAAQPGESTLALLDCTLEDPTLVELDSGLPEKVGPAGDLLWAALHSNASVGTALDAMLQVAGAPLYMRVGSGRTEQFPWEVLRAPGKGFLALDRWPIARLTNDAVVGDAPFDFDPPLRMLVVLAAATIKAQGEWEAIKEAIATPKVPVELQVLVAEPALKAIVEADIGPDRVAFTQDRRFLESKAKEFRPHLFHLFCHGRPPRGGGGPTVELATVESWDGAAGENIILEPRDLHSWLGNTCITTLCACQGGGAGEGANSFAFLLAGRGMPAVVAMRRPIASTDANAFTRAHYSVLLAAMQAAVDGDPLDLATTSVDARGAISDNYGRPRGEIAEVHAEWSHPVIYLRAERLRFEVAPGSGARPLATLTETEVTRLRSRLETLRNARRQLPTDMPADVFQKIDEEVLAVTKQLYG